MTSIQSALFDNREALANEGEIERKEALTRAATASEALALDADNELAKAGYDKNGNRLGSDDKPVPSDDIMSNRKRSMMPRNATDESNWLTISANKGSEMKSSTSIEAEIDASRAYTVEFAKHCSSFAEPCNQNQLLARIDAGLLLLADARSQYHVDFLAFTIKSDCDEPPPN
ncbi:hypothetical protein V5279_22510 [Bradyrhizobium sp. 26S5]|uniref:hypothetical protein n=1 Tax=Bradyrhizobium sp. 26S5 TaxID=3139729 RepID=UPI0030D5BADF